MKRTQVYLTSGQMTFLKHLSQKQGVTLSQMLRNIIDEVKSLKKQTKKNQTAGSFLDGIAKIAKKKHWRGPRDLSQKLDTYLYGKK